MLEGARPPFVLFHDLARREWRSAPSQVMVALVKRRWSRPLIYVLVAAQLLLSAPAMAFSSGASGVPAASTTIPCDHQMNIGHRGDKCPCCPDGGMSMPGCLAACALSAAAMPSRETFIRVSARALRLEPMASIRFASLSSPPLNPPPIV